MPNQNRDVPRLTCCMHAQACTSTRDIQNSEMEHIVGMMHSAMRYMVYKYHMPAGLMTGTSCQYGHPLNLKAYLHGGASQALGNHDRAFLIVPSSGDIDMERLITRLQLLNLVCGCPECSMGAHDMASGVTSLCHTLAPMHLMLR